MYIFMCVYILPYTYIYICVCISEFTHIHAYTHNNLSIHTMMCVYLLNICILRFTYIFEYTRAAIYGFILVVIDIRTQAI